MEVNENKHTESRFCLVDFTIRMKTNDYDVYTLSSRIFSTVWHGHNFSFTKYS